jgi:hypothetical protein
MAQVVYRANLSAKAFPFLPTDWGRTVIVPQQDNNFNRQLASNEDADKDVGIPQIYYADNVMPFAQGFQSVGYVEVSPPTIFSFTKQFTLRDDNGNELIAGFVDTGGGTSILFFNYGSGWTNVSGFSIATSAVAELTTAYIGGITYVFLPIAGYCFRWDFSTNLPVSVTLSGLTVGASAIIGICSSAGYMVAWSKNKLFWSSTLPITADVVDFVPSVITGAGSISAEAIKGPILFCAPHQMGFIIYSSENAVLSIYTGNFLAPFQLREIVSSGGITDNNYFAYDANSGNHYIYGTSGLQLVSSSAAQTTMPEVTDFISGRKIETYDTFTNTIITTELNAPLKKKLALISDRYLVISYGITALTNALIYDLILKRWGKLKVNHVDCFEYNLPSRLVIETPKQNMAFLQASGAIQVLSFSELATAPAQDATLILGKFQYVRSRLLQLDQIDLESIRSDKTAGLKVLSSVDGKNFSVSSPYAQTPVGLERTYRSRAIGINHSLVITGSFRLNSVILSFNIHGKR